MAIYGNTVRFSSGGFLANHAAKIPHCQSLRLQLQQVEVEAKEDSNSALAAKWGGLLPSHPYHFIL